MYHTFLVCAGIIRLGGFAKSLLFIPEHVLYLSSSLPAIVSDRPFGSWLPSASGGWQSNSSAVQCTSIFTPAVFGYSLLPTASGRLNLPIFMLLRNSLNNH